MKYVNGLGYLCCHDSETMLFTTFDLNSSPTAAQPAVRHAHRGKPAGRLEMDYARSVTFDLASNTNLLILLAMVDV